ncbi:(-)-kolavenyl diphosphate synthase TPS10, chloroplastic [Linum grandiflorum]
MLNSMEDGETNVSAYDTAWLALVKDVNDETRPRFPESIEWIANNQLRDGSWGDADIFQAHDRILNTLACVIALATWNLHPDKCQLGLNFFNENLSRLEEENMTHMPIGFEVVFPKLLELANGLNLEVDPHHFPALQQIYDAGKLKLEKIPKDILHRFPTTLLYSLEGMGGLDWEKLLRFQNEDGSFLFSPASTAYALSQTNDQKCFEYLSKIAHKFQGGVPNVYPVDLFENIWAIDRLQRLGISRYFQPEIRKCLDYIEKFWDEKGIAWASKSQLHDVDVTAMGFRILRMHGRPVSPDVFNNFEKDGGLFSLVGQSGHTTTELFNVYRASQMLFPGEEILENSKQGAYKLLRKKQASNELFDKWIITKDLPGEVGYALDVPFYASLPRLESRFFIEHYGGDEDVWIGKTLYRMYFVNNNEYLELAKIDYNDCQVLHRMEWDNLQKWYEEHGMREFGLTEERLLLRYYLAAATVFEQNRSEERMAWAKTAALLEVIRSFFNNNNSKDQRAAFVHEFTHHDINGVMVSGEKTRQDLVRLIAETLDSISLVQGRNIGRALQSSWEEWLLKWEEEGDISVGEAELVVNTISLTANSGLKYSEEDGPLFRQLANLTNKVCHQLAHFRNTGCLKTTNPEIETGMQQLVRIVTQPTAAGNEEEEAIRQSKQTFLDVAKTFYYTAICGLSTIEHHISKVLFQTV